MPPIKFERVVSCSSEDPAYPSKNLLLGRDFNRKWKCKEAGEGSATIILQLSQPYLITGVDIGNESSAFVEVLVSRTSTPDDYEVLLGMSSFMSPMDAKNEDSNNRHRVRMFTADNLTESVRKEKWDRIKVVCTQPFNRHIQYGLSFIVLHTTEAKQESRSTSPNKALGRFILKDEEETDISIGSFFSRRKDLQATPPSPIQAKGAAAVRDAGSPAAIEEKKTAKRKGSGDSTDSQKKKRGRPTLSPDSSKTNGSPHLVDQKTKRDNHAKKDKSNDKGKTNVGTSDSPDPKIRSKALTGTAGSSNSAGESFSKDQSTLKKIGGTKRNVTFKPFNKLFEGVGIVISGYENPGRSQFRDKALAMGATYSQNWNNSTSTHLICAFTSTPKYREVKGKAIIVTREWIDDCFRERKKLSWQRYALDKNDQKDANSSSEPEVWELIPDMSPPDGSPLPPASRRNNIAIQDTRVGSESEDSEDEIERIRAKQNQKQGKHDKDRKNVTNETYFKTPEKNKTEHKNDEYNCSTDIDSDEETEARLNEWSKDQNKRLKDGLPPLPDFFHGKTFFLASDLIESDKNSLKRYILAYGGEILKSENDSVNYIITNNKTEPSDASVSVTPDWVWECNDHQRLVSPILYEPN
ncbi:DNA repair protein XRCC1 [Frankliniella fusca]|uniref:DNA repair protein XRCC1 n=1 Tax=Frankliniella fusca TaxID=407009 RepID=A0AAE1H072_9NEOP|nr:DNA repair protein XRCC1 [Frankliniella fusca]